MFKQLVKWSSSLTMVSKGLLIGLALYFTIFPILSCLYIYKVNSENIKSLQATGRVALASAVSFLEIKDTPSACSVLNLAVGESGLRYYSVRMKGLDICFGPESTSPSEFLPKLQNHVDKKLITLQRYEVPKTDYQIVFSNYSDSFGTFGIALKKRIPTIILNMFLVLGIIGALVWVISMPFRSISSTLARRKVSSLDSIGKIGVSKESTLLTKGVAVSAEHIQELEQNISFIAKDFSSFLIPKSRSELPYTFDAAFLRFDINGYTRLYFKQHKRRITELISRIARDVDEIANRYNGFHYSFGGDEFIDVFDGEDGIVRAFFAARAIFSLSENLDKDLSTKIRFKASIHRDKQTLFDKIPQCYTLTSDSLVFTARFFDAVEDRDNNSLMVGEVDLESIRDFSQTEGGDTHKFKNVEEPIRVYRALLNQSSNVYLNPAFVPYLRTNNDILQLITLAPEVENDLKASILKALKSIPVSFGSESFRDAWLSALTSFDKAKNFIHLSSFINTGKNLITKDCWTVELTECVQNLDALEDARVEADAIELLSLKVDSKDLQKWIHSRNISHNHYRSSGNVLIADGLNNLDDSFFEKVSQLIDSDDMNSAATGIFVASVVLRHYRETDPVRLSQYLHVDNVVSMIEALCSSKNQMVSSRANTELENLRSARVI